MLHFFKIVRFEKHGEYINFDFFNLSFDLTRFCDTKWNFRILFFDKKISLQASDKVLVPLTIGS